MVSSPDGKYITLKLDVQDHYTYAYFSLLAYPICVF